MAMARILCVAEKPSIAKAVANHLGGNASAVSTMPMHLCNALAADLRKSETSKVFNS